MAINLIDTAKGLITPDVISKISSIIGETPAKTQQAMGTVVPTLAGVACNEASTPGGASRLFNLVTNTQLPSDLHTNLGGLLSGGAATDGLLKTGSGLISSLLGDRAGSVAVDLITIPRPDPSHLFRVSSPNARFEPSLHKS